ncbi:MAG: hypothetical protein KAQ81_14090, partial [Deltaproteobacteria bacterium]|nr:hypothetical protein [Deltaproteobacteria bacterium]
MNPRRNNKKERKSYTTIEKSIPQTPKISIPVLQHPFISCEQKNLLPTKGSYFQHDTWVNPDIAVGIVARR